VAAVARCKLLTRSGAYVRGAGAPLALLAAIGGRAGIIACAEALDRAWIGGSC
jgi:hypothetical protein